jgi:hypothetical protein
LPTFLKLKSFIKQKRLTLAPRKMAAHLRIIGMPNSFVASTQPRRQNRFVIEEPTFDVCSDLHKMLQLNLAKNDVLPLQVLTNMKNEIVRVNADKKMTFHERRQAVRAKFNPHPDGSSLACVTNTTLAAPLVDERGLAWFKEMLWTFRHQSTHTSFPIDVYALGYFMMSKTQDHRHNVRVSMFRAFGGETLHLHQYVAANQIFLTDFVVVRGELSEQNVYCIIKASALSDVLLKPAVSANPHHGERFHIRDLRRFLFGRGFGRDNDKLRDDVLAMFESSMKNFDIFFKEASNGGDVNDSVNALDEDDDEDYFGVPWISII